MISLTKRHFHQKRDPRPSTVFLLSKKRLSPLKQSYVSFRKIASALFCSKIINFCQFFINQHIQKNNRQRTSSRTDSPSTVLFPRSIDTEYFAFALQTSPAAAETPCMIERCIDHTVPSVSIYPNLPSIRTTARPSLKLEANA